MRRMLISLALAALMAACGDATGPSYGPPTLTQANGVTVPTGATGMDVFLEGFELAVPPYGRVYFLGADGRAIAAEASEWTNEHVVAKVPPGIGRRSKVWVQTRWGISDSLDFEALSATSFSPTDISWTRTADLPQALQGAGAAYVPVIYGASRTRYVFVIGGAADVTGVATPSVYRGTLQESGAISSWVPALAQLPNGRAYHAVAAATPYTARLDTATAAHVYAIGGIDPTGASLRSVVYNTVGLDGSLGSWRATAELPAAVHSARAVAYRDYIYLVGGASVQNAPVATVYRAGINADGSLDAWETQPVYALPRAVAHHGLVNFGPYLYVVGGDTAAVDPAAGPSGTETAAVYMARITMKNGTIASWIPATTPNAARSKHGLLSSGTSVVVTSGHSGPEGASENGYSTISTNGTLSDWGGAVGGNTIQSVLGYGLYNLATVAFTDSLGRGHVVVLGGAQQGAPGRASAGVVHY